MHIGVIQESPKKPKVIRRASRGGSTGLGWVKHGDREGPSIRQEGALNEAGRLEERNVNVS